MDCGLAINPDSVRAQVEGGLIFGLTAALYSDITFQNGRVMQSNFNDYRMLRIDQTPPIDVHIVPSTESPGGIGETGTVSAAPVLGNAIFAATGQRLRRYPFDRAQLRGKEAPRASPCRRARQTRRRWRTDACMRRILGGSLAIVLVGIVAAARVLLLAGAGGKGLRLGEPAARPGADPARRISRDAPPIASPATPRPAASHYAGGLPFKLPFGTIYASNITPDKETGIGNWTDADFVRALHRGVGKDGEMLYPAFPYASYALMSTDDALAIKAYLFSLPAVHAPTPATQLDFPYDQRYLLRGLAPALRARASLPARCEPSPRTGTAATTSSRRWAIAANATRRATRSTGSTMAASSPAPSPRAGRRTTSPPTAMPGIGAWSDAQIASYLSQGYADGPRRRLGQHGRCGRAQPALPPPRRHPRHGRLSAHDPAAEVGSGAAGRARSAGGEGLDRLQPGAG